MKKDRYSTISEEEAERLRQVAAAFSVAVNETIEKIAEALEPFYIAAGMTVDQAAEAVAALTARYFAAEEAKEARKRKPYPCPTRELRPHQEAMRPKFHAQISPARKRPHARSTIRKRGNRRRP